ncbi:hypothetical protein CXG81DRAFT_19439 [Caulochytrium protostelioides]|uniref:DUF4874 domain-containing protein n=1 Tax=Caulochytrium protostelioides TaxID=1555241 RepID=A0A4P9WZB9_9FUNG|nr:hypothetical protein CAUPRSCDRAFT_10305 [Caulochytrium protostelioides]RKP00632.1 hypothetical protein CXG81DRAFT_19439 [Caulochytrium protostelioides]|eukprot:RKP00632.1 hypothetical protein CXG81DRAFT_19439 [Caulochytrium protostelioides]
MQIAALLLAIVAAMIPAQVGAVAALHGSRAYDSSGNPTDGWSGDWHWAASAGIAARVYIYLETNSAGADRSTLVGNLRKSMESAKSAGVHVIPRAFYLSGEPSDVNAILRDAQAIAGAFKDYCHSQTVHAIEAGFLGVSYGEWWGSRFAPDGLDTSDAVANAKKGVVNALKTSGCFVLMRYPRDIADYFDGDEQIGMHDDCALSRGIDGDDSGTLSKAAAAWGSRDTVTAALDYVQNRIKGPIVGEACEDNAPSCATVIAWIKRFRAAFFNNAFPSSYQNVLSNAACTTLVVEALSVNARIAFSLGGGAASGGKIDAAPAASSSAPPSASSSAQAAPTVTLAAAAMAVTTTEAAAPATDAAQAPSSTQVEVFAQTSSAAAAVATNNASKSNGRNRNDNSQRVAYNGNPARVQGCWDDKTQQGFVSCVTNRDSLTGLQNYELWRCPEGRCSLENDFNEGHACALYTQCKGTWTPWSS